MLKTLSDFYFSRILGKRIYLQSGKTLGKLKDIFVDISQIRPKAVSAKVKIDSKEKMIDFAHVTISKKKGQYVLICNEVLEFELPMDNILSLKKHILDRQLVDMDGRKLVRVNDIKLALLSTGIYLIAVDVGVEGLLRRLGVAKTIKKVLKPFKRSIPGQLILWNEVATVDYSHAGIKLTKKYSKLSTLHPSDIADIIEELDLNTRIDILTSLEEEQAADVFEEMETDMQVSVLESLSAEKAADMLELMPADEVADILDEMETDKAEELLNIMDKETSDEVREIMKYPDNSVGSFMSTEFIAFNGNVTVEEAINELRKLQPDSDTIYYLYVLDKVGRLTATVSLRDLVVSMPDIQLKKIMNEDPTYVFDHDKINSIAELISKYNLLALPVVDKNMKMVGIVIIDDVIYDLTKSKRR